MREKYWTRHNNLRIDRLGSAAAQAAGGAVILGVIRLGDARLEAKVLSDQWLLDQTHVAAEIAGRMIVAVATRRVAGASEKIFLSTLPQPTRISSGCAASSPPNPRSIPVEGRLRGMTTKAMRRKTSFHSRRVS
jgi:hypothetical protein